MPKGAPKFKTTTKSAGNTASRKKKQDDDFDAQLESALVAVNPNRSAASAAAAMAQQQQQLRQMDPVMIQYLQLLKRANLLDQEMKKGETAKQRESREEKENKMRNEIYVGLRQQQEAMKQMQQQQEAAMVAEKMKYENKFIPLKPEDGEWTELAPGKWIRYEQFQNDADMPMVCDIFVKNLSEPYTTFTYMHFMHGWKDLCIMLMGHEGKTKPAASVRGNLIGCVVSRVTRMRTTYLPMGYVAMLAIEEGPFRGHKLGQELVLKTVDLMKQKECVVVQLETPCGNQRALDLYLNLGFVKTKYFVRYYMDGSDAVRLRLFTKPFNREDAPLLDDVQ